MFGFLKPQPGINASGNVGNFIFGDVTGNVTQLFIQGAVPEPPSLPWRVPQDDGDVFGLLSWRSRLAPLVGRNYELDRVLTWARRTVNVSVRFLTGAGGAGKSRLAAEAAQTLRDDEWIAGFVAFDQPRIVPMSAKGLFLVIDYAEENRSQLIALLTHLARTDSFPSPLRLLFLSRRDPDWWRADIDAAHAADICDHQPLSLEKLDAAQTVQLVGATQTGLGTHLHLPQPTPDPGAALAWYTRDPELHGLPLFAQAAAIHSMLEQQPLTLAGGDIMRALVRRERLRIDNIGRKSGFEPQGATRLVGLAAAAGEIDVDRLRRLADPALELGIPPPARIVDAVAVLPHWDGMRIAAITPGLLGSELLMEVLADRPDRAADWLWTVLGEASVEWVQLIERRAHDAMTLRGPQEQRLSTWLAAMIEKDPGRATFLESVVSQRGARATLPLALGVARTLLAEPERPPEARAALLMNLSNLLPLLGGVDEAREAVAAVETALGIYRELARTDPETYEPRVASSLNNLANRRSEAGDRTGALDAIREAIDAWAALFDKQPEVVDLHLGDALTNYSVHLSHSGLIEQAVAVGREAIAHYRTLVAKGHRLARVGLATALDNLSQHLLTGGDAMDDNDAALVAVREAVEIRERLAAEDPRYEPDLIGSLRVYASRLGSTDAPRAMTVAQRAVTLARGLVDQDQRRYGVLLAIASETLAARLAAAGDHGEAIATIDSILPLLEDATARNPDRGRPQLAVALTQQTTYLRLARRTDEAIETGLRAIREIERLYQAHPLRYGRSFMQILNEVSNMQRARGDVAKAVFLAHVAVNSGQWLATQAPDVYDFELASTLMTFHLALLDHGQPQEALIMVERAVDILRRLVAAQPDRFDLQLARALKQQLDVMLVLKEITLADVPRHPLFLESITIINRLTAKGLV